jgi:hypothetical protein
VKPSKASAPNRAQKPNYTIKPLAIWQATASQKKNPALQRKNEAQAKTGEDARVDGIREVCEME